MTVPRAGVGLESLEYREESGTHWGEFDAETTDASTAVIGALTSASNVDASALDSLYGDVDPDALDAIVDGSHERDDDLSVTFATNGYAVTVSGRGTVTVAPDRPAGDDRRVPLR